MKNNALYNIWPNITRCIIGVFRNDTFKTKKKFKKVKFSKKKSIKKY